MCCASQKHQAEQSSLVAQQQQQLRKLQQLHEQEKRQLVEQIRANAAQHAPTSTSAIAAPAALAVPPQIEQALIENQGAASAATAVRTTGEGPSSTQPPVLHPSSSLGERVTVVQQLVRLQLQQQQQLSALQRQRQQQQQQLPAVPWQAAAEPPGLPSAQQLLTARPQVLVNFLARPAAAAAAPDRAGPSPPPVRAAEGGVAASTADTSRFSVQGCPAAVTSSTLPPGPPAPAPPASVPSSQPPTSAPLVQQVAWTQRQALLQRNLSAGVPLSPDIGARAALIPVPASTLAPAPAPTVNSQASPPFGQQRTGASAARYSLAGTSVIPSLTPARQAFLQALDLVATAASQPPQQATSAARRDALRHMAATLGAPAMAATLTPGDVAQALRGPVRAAMQTIPCASPASTAATATASPPGVPTAGTTSGVCAAATVDAALCEGVVQLVRAALCGVYKEVVRNLEALTPPLIGPLCETCVAPFPLRRYFQHTWASAMWGTQRVACRERPSRRRQPIPALLPSRATALLPVIPHSLPAGPDRAATAVTVAAEVVEAAVEALVAGVKEVEEGASMEVEVGQ